ncbi:MAG: hypothetical protein QW806_08690 [Nitrososphaerota archaeon]
MIKLNCLISEKEVNNLKVKAIELKESINYGDLFKKHLDLLYNFAIGYPYKGILYFIGDENYIAQQLKDFVKGSSIQQLLDFKIKEHRNIFAYIFYRAFIKKLIEVGYVPMRGIHKKKKLIPSLKLEKFIEPLDKNNNIYVCYGIKFGIKILRNNKILLFIDLYSPPCLHLGKRLFPIFSKGLKEYDLYKTKAVLSSKERYKKLEEVIEVLKEGKDKVYVMFPNEYVLSFLPDFISLNKYFHMDEIMEPSLEFRNGYSRNPLVGLVKYKPYSYLQNISVNLFLIVDDKVEKQKVDRLINYLQNGCKDKYAEFYGFQTIFGTPLKIDGIRYVSINNTQDIKNEINKLPISISKSIIIVIFRDEIAPRGTIRGAQFYKELKYFCIKNGIKSQFIRESTLDRLDKNGKSLIIFNFSTAIYAKSGGTPWKIKEVAPPGTSITGIAFTVNHQLKEINAGTLYLFDRLGRHLYLLTRRYKLPLTKGLYIPYNIMKKMLEEIIGKFPWIKYMIFHKSAPYHDDEKKAISECLDKKIEYSLLYLRSNPLMRIFKTDIENFSIMRGAYTIIKESFDDSFILCTTGNVHDDFGIRKRSEIFGTPKPIEIIIEENLIKNLEISKIAEQILLLTKLDWNTCNIEVREPITIKYARKAASLLPLYEEEYLTTIYDIRDIM